MTHYGPAGRCRYAHGGFEKRLWETMCPFGSRKFCEYGEQCPMNHADNSDFVSTIGDSSDQDGQFGADAELELLQEGFELPSTTKKKEGNCLHGSLLKSRFIFVRLQNLLFKTK